MGVVGGILTERVMTCKEVAQVLNITTNGVYKLEQSALRKLRKSPTLYLAFLESIERSGERRSSAVGTLYPDERE